MSEIFADVIAFDEAFDFLGLAAFVIAFSIVAYSAYKFLFDQVFRQRVLSVIGGLALSLSYFAEAFFSVGSRSIRPPGRMDFEEWLSQIDERERALTASRSPLSEASEAEIVDLFRQSLDDNLSDQIRDQIDQVIETRSEQKIDREIEKSLWSARVRIESFSSSISARGIVSLLFGIAAAVGALLVLRDLTTNFEPALVSELNYNTVIFILISRVSLAIFITFISYFFLSLYRRSLEDVHVYQAELTNIDAWLAAIAIAKSREDEALGAFIACKLMETDRQIEVNPTKETGSTRKDDVKLSAEILKDIVSKIK
ncbi:hypothetical protein ACI5KX_00350 [Erythrobacter sp. GH1-10]|uniref:hypothetical protein n=1 Tax=Erythrobacter sp. GH1-10 TaxID=3349334 RepID=UPI0038780417